MGARQRVPEIMDDPLLDEALHRGALHGLERLNAIGGSSRILASTIKPLAARISPDEKPLKVLDLACGGGDIAIELSKYFARRNLSVDIFGVDVSSVAVAHATTSSAAASAPCRFRQMDVLNDELPGGFDVIMTSLFTHHLEPEQVERLLAKMAAAATQLVLISDLERSTFSLMSVRLACHIVTGSPVVRHDGPASVRAAFTPTEMLNMAHKAGLAGASVRRHFPCRMLLSWTKTN